MKNCTVLRYDSWKQNEKERNLYTVGSHHECDVIYGGWCKQHRKRRCGHNHCVFVDHCGKSLLISLK